MVNNKCAIQCPAGPRGLPGPPVPPGLSGPPGLIGQKGEKGDSRSIGRGKYFRRFENHGCWIYS